MMNSNILYNIDLSINALMQSENPYVPQGYIKKIIDQPDDNTIYIGWSRPGELESTELWTISKILKVDTLTILSWALNVAWDDRVTATYIQ